ncbi:MAG: glycosyltransferase [Chthoniobacteraceae bacterium]
MNDSRPSILVLAPFPPWPLRSGGSACIYPRLVALAERYRVHLVCTAPAAEEEAAAIRGQLEKHCASVTFFPMFCRKVRWHTREGLLRQALGLFGPDLRGAMNQVRAARRAAEEVAAREPIELIQCEASMLYEVVWTSPRLRRLPCVAVELNIEHEYAWESAQAKGGALNLALNWMAAQHLRRYCRAAYQRIGEVRFISPRDFAYWQAQLGTPAQLSVGDVLVKDPGIWRNPRAGAGTGCLALLGTMAAPQVAQGAAWLAREVVPQIRGGFPGFHLLLSRSLAPLFAQELEQGLRLEFLDEASFAAADRQLIACDGLLSPIFKGSGIKMKNVIAFALGLPVVATSKSLEGIPVVPGEAAWIADDARGFAAAALRLLSDGPVREQGCAAARRFYESRYAPRVAAEGWFDLVERHRTQRAR